MIKFFIFIFLLLFINNSFAEDSLLTLKQKLDRLQRDVNDLSKSVFSANKNTNYDQSSNLTAIDIRIYDLEKDIKNLNLNFEELVFEIDDLKKLYEEINLKLDTQFQINDQNLEQITQSEIKENNEVVNSGSNTLGNLIISSENLDENIKSNEKIEIQINKNLSQEEQFQIALDFLMSQQFDKARFSLKQFIADNQDSKFSGSAHYWLGEIYILKKEYREAALILAEGFQKYPKSTKAPDMLFKLSESLVMIEKKIEACNTLIKFSNEYSKHKLIEQTNKKMLELKCLINDE